MSSRSLNLPMSISMDGFEVCPDRTIVWVTASTDRDHDDQPHRLTREGAPEATEGEPRWES